MSFNSKNQISQKYINKFLNLIDTKTLYGRDYDSEFYPTCNQNCWKFLGRIDDRDGYGRIEIDFNKTILAHRFSYLLHVGDIPSKKLIRHICDVRSCVNPNHLLIGTHQDNKNDCVNRKRVPVGENVPQSKLSNNDVRDILVAVHNGVYNNTYQIANEYCLHFTTISAMFYGDTWKNITNSVCKNLNVSLNDLRKKVLDEKFSKVLDETKVRKIKLMILEGIPIKDISKIFKVTRSNLYRIKNNRSWSQVKI